MACPRHTGSRNPFAGFRAKDYPTRFWALVGLVLMFTLMRFSEAFLVLRAQDAGLSSNWIPLTLVVMSATYLLTAYPAGKLSDRMSRHVLLALGCVVMLVADLMLAFATSLPWVMLGIALWGVHMGLTEGLIAALTADYAPEKLRGSAFGVINLARGVMALLASALAGGLWTWSGPTATFITGAGLAILTALLALSMRVMPAHAAPDPGKPGPASGYTWRMSLRTRLAEFGFESNDDYDHALRCLFGQQQAHLRVLHVDGMAGRRKTAFAQALGRALDYPHVLYHDFSAAEAVAMAQPIVLDDGSLGVPEAAPSGFERVMTEACAYSEASPTLVILDQLQSANFADQARLYHFVMEREWNGAGGAATANAKNLVLALISEQPIYHSLAKCSYRVWTDAQRAFLDYRPADYGLGPEAPGTVRLDRDGLRRAGSRAHAQRIRAPALRPDPSRAQRRADQAKPVRPDRERGQGATVRAGVGAAPAHAAGRTGAPSGRRRSQPRRLGTAAGIRRWRTRPWQASGSR